MKLVLIIQIGLFIVCLSIIQRFFIDKNVFRCYCIIVIAYAQIRVTDKKLYGGGNYILIGEI